MRTRHLLAAALLGLPTVALAQPTPEPPPPPPPTTQSLSPDEVRAIADEAAAAAVAAERARVAAEKAEREAREGVPVAPPPETTEAAEEDYTHGADGLVDGRLNFTFTNENLLTKPGETVPSVPGWRF